MSIVVTGGAGYIGAHVVRLLEEQGRDVVVVDDLSTGRADRIGNATLVQLDLSSPEAPDTLQTVFEEREVTAVVHFAARKQVGESVERPSWYFAQNVGGLTNLLTAMEAAGVRDMIFSSSAAVYGQPEEDMVDEHSPTVPINPYGETKLIGEWMLRDAARAWGLRWYALRYFNVAGAAADDLGDPAVLNLIPMVFKRLDNGRPPAIFGQDYPTPDGTCVRDYVHVADLAAAHVVALERLETGATPANPVLNVGTGIGSSVREVVDEIGRATGLDVTPELAERRPGDPATLVARADLILSELGWKSEYDLADIVSSAWTAWQESPGS